MLRAGGSPCHRGICGGRALGHGRRLPMGPRGPAVAGPAKSGTWAPPPPSFPLRQSAGGPAGLAALRHCASSADTFTEWRGASFHSGLQLTCFFLFGWLVLIPCRPRLRGRRCSQHVPPLGVGCRGSAQAGCSHGMRAGWGAVSGGAHGRQGSSIGCSFPAWPSVPSRTASSLLWQAARLTLPDILKALASPEPGSWRSRWRWSTQSGTAGWMNWAPRLLVRSWDGLQGAGALPGLCFGWAGWCSGRDRLGGIGAGASFLPDQPGEERGAGMSRLQILLLLVLPGAEACCWQAPAAAWGQPAVSACGAGNLAGVVLAARRPGWLRMGCSLTSCPAPLCCAAFPFLTPAPAAGNGDEPPAPIPFLGHLRLRAGWDALGRGPITRSLQGCGPLPRLGRQGTPFPAACPLPAA